MLQLLRRLAAIASAAAFAVVVHAPVSAQMILIGDDTIGPNQVHTTGQTDEFCLTYEATGTTWEWQTCDIWTDNTGNYTPTDVDTDIRVESIQDRNGPGTSWQITAGGAGTFSSITSPANATDGGSLTLSEDTDHAGATHTWALQLAQTDLAADATCTIDSSGLLPASDCLDTATYTGAKCVYVENPTASDDRQSVWIANGFTATITKIWCESDQTVNADLQIDDGTPADVAGTDLVCGSTPAEDEIGLTGAMADGDRLDLAITSVAGTPTWVSLCWTYTRGT